jgi:short-chain fatty acids transporter
MLKRFTNACVKLVDRWLPDPFLFAIVLTLVVFGAAVALTDQTPVQVLAYWGDFKKGFWNLLTFSMQTSMIVVFGSTLAKTKVFSVMISSLAGIATSSASAIILITIVSGVFSWLNYGLGLIIGALLSKAIVKKMAQTHPDVKLDYRLLIAAAYSGFVIWHQGLSGSIPLTISTGFKVGEMNIIAPITETLFHPINLITVVACLLLLCVVNVAMTPDEEHTITVDPSLLADDEFNPTYEIKTPADRMEHSKILWLATVILGWAYIIYYFHSFAASGKSVLNGLGRNSVNIVLLFSGILLHGDLRRYVDALKSSVSSVAGVILQYPFYAGIMAIMVGTDAAGASLAKMISNFFVQHSTKLTFPFFTFISAGIVNFLVPSGGGQWAVQAPIVMQAASEIGVPQSLAAMAIAFGDQWTNMIQPFWALPALAVAGLKAKDIMGFMVVVTIASGIVLGVGIFAWAFFI